MTPLEKLAIRLAIEAPEKQAKYSKDAKVTWETVHELRDELDRLGFDWRAASKEYQGIVKERRREWFAGSKKLSVSTL